MHCLNGCKIALNQGEYTWPFNILSCIVNSVDKSKFTLYSDMPGHQSLNGGTVPPKMIVTTLKYDIIVIIAEKEN